MKYQRVLYAAAASLLLSSQFGSSAGGTDIKCVDDYQLVNGYGPILTPYCEDYNLTKVAQSYGMKYSFAEVRHNPTIKYDICYAIGHDTRVHSACAGIRSDGDGERRK